MTQVGFHCYALCDKMVSNYLHFKMIYDELYMNRYFRDLKLVSIKIASWLNFNFELFLNFIFEVFVSHTLFGENEFLYYASKCHENQPSLVFVIIFHI